MIIIPVAAETPLHEVPRVTYAVLGILFLVWLVLAFLWIGETTNHITPGTRAALIQGLSYVDNERHLWTYLTSSLIHSSVIHLLSNMIFIWLFGCYVEERLGWFRYLVLLLVGAAAGDIAFSWGLWHFEDHTGRSLPLMGASDMVTAIFGAQLVLLPHIEYRFIWIFIFYFRPFVSDTFTLPAAVCIPIWFLLDLLGLYLYGTSSVVAHTAHVGGFIWGAAFGLWVRFLPGSQIFERSRQRLENARVRREARLDYRNFQIALKGDAPKAAFDIYRRTRKTENPLPITTGERMDLANQLLVFGDVLAAGSVYRDVLKTETDANIIFEAALRLARIALQRLGDVTEAKDLLRMLHGRYKNHRRFSEVLDLIEQVREIEGRSLQGTG